MIHSFGFAISLRVVGSGHCNFDSKKFSKALKQSQGEFWISITNEFVSKAKSFVNIVKIGVGGVQGSHSFVAGD